MDIQERHSRFIKWRNDLEERLALCLFLSENSYNRYIKPLIDKSKLPKLKVEVVESPSKAGAWEVYVNGRIVNYYNGPEAHLKATRRAGEIANEA